MTSFWQIVESTFSLHDSVDGRTTVDIAFFAIIYIIDVLMPLLIRQKWRKTEGRWRQLDIAS